MLEKKEYRYIKTEPIKTIAGDKQIQENMRMNNWLAITYLFMLYRHNGDITKLSEANQQVFRKEKRLYKCGTRAKLRDNLITLQQNWDKAKELPIINEDILTSISDSHLDFDLSKCYKKYMEEIDNPENPATPNVRYFDAHQMIMDCLDEHGNIINDKAKQKQMCEELSAFLNDVYERSVQDEQTKKTEDESDGE